MFYLIFGTSLVLDTRYSITPATKQIRQVSQVVIRDAKLLSTQDDALADTRHDEDERVPGQPAALYDAFIARLYAAFESPSDRRRWPSARDVVQAAADAAARLVRRRRHVAPIGPFEPSSVTYIRSCGFNCFTTVSYTYINMSFF